MHLRKEPAGKSNKCKGPVAGLWVPHWLRATSEGGERSRTWGLRREVRLALDQVLLCGPLWGRGHLLARIITVTIGGVPTEEWYNLFILQQDPSYCRVEIEEGEQQGAQVKDQPKHWAERLWSPDQGGDRHTLLTICPCSPPSYILQN